jgi:hypothetical protein
MAITIVQTSSEMIVSSGTSGTLTLNGVTSGNLLVTQLTQETDNQPFVTNTDGTNTWAIDQQKNDSTRGSACLQSAQNVASGNTVVTVAPLTGSKTFHGRMHEVSGCVTTGVDAVSGIEPDAGSSSHVCSADASHINPSGACICFTSSAASSGLGTRTPGSGYTAVSTAGNFTFWQYQIFTSAPTNERGAWTGNAVTTNGVIAAYVAAAGGGGGGSNNATVFLLKA